MKEPQRIRFWVERKQRQIMDVVLNEDVGVAHFIRSHEPASSLRPVQARYIKSSSEESDWRTSSTAGVSILDGEREEKKNSC